MLKEITIPDIGNAKNVDVIEVHVKSGDKITKEAPLLTLESDKASMDIPAPYTGIIKELKVKVGDKVSQGSVIMMIDVAEESAAAKPAGQAEAPVKKAETAAPQKEATPSPSTAGAEKIMDVKVPDIGNAKNVDVITVHVKAGDNINKEDALITLESDKASMDIPAPETGVVDAVKVKVGDKLSQNDLILTLKISSSATVAEKLSTTTQVASPKPQEQVNIPNRKETDAPATQAAADASIYAGPSVRRVAREFGVNLSLVKATGEKGRILIEDVQAFVKNQLSGSSTNNTGFSLPAAPEIDFSQFGPIESQALSRIKKRSGSNLQRNWVSIPHVTQFDEADITELENFRLAHKTSADGTKLTALVFLMKAVVACLKVFPTFNSSLDPSGENLILKKYFHIGVAVDTPEGLVVPVIRNVDQKSLFELAKELAAVSERARAKKFTPDDMQGSCFSISSLGGIGGTAFTPIINAPDVAILGVSKSAMKPVYHEGEFVPRLMLPLSLSYDHRVIDGALAARFTTRLAQYLGDIRQLLL